MLDVPLAAHGLAAAFATFSMKQDPFAPSGRLGADPRIVLSEASFQVGCPAHIGSAIICVSAPQHINKKEPFVL